MITTVADLLEALVEREKNLLARQPNLNHAPMLGDMYEGLARSVVRQALFSGLNLHVTEGKIEHSDGKLSGQMDCMIVEGNGHRLPYTDHFIYPFTSVIAVLEIKKSLLGSELSDAFVHLRELKDRNATPQTHTYRLARDAWRSLVGRDLPSSDEFEELPIEEKMLHQVIVTEASRPLRVVLGYFGYKSEFQLRKGLLRFLAGHVAPASAPRKIAGFGINSFPSQVMCREAHLLKLDGMPFGSRLLADGYWPFLASRREKPLHTFLELLWTRLAYRYELDPSIFGEDPSCEFVNVLLEAKWCGQGWGYRHRPASETKLQESRDLGEWNPAFLTLSEFVLLQELCRDKEVRLDDEDLAQFLAKQGTTPTAITSSLFEKRLAYEQAGTLHLLTDQCWCVILPDGRYVAGENKSGRLLRWVERFTEQYSKAT